MSTPSTGRSAGNDKARLVQFRLGDAERIAKVVGIVEGARRQPKGSVLPRAAGGGGVQLALFTGAWSVGQEKSVKIQADTNATTSVVNQFFPNIGFSVSERTCAISSGLLVAIQC